MSKLKNKFFNVKKTIPYSFIWSKEKPLSYITEAYQKFLANLEYVNIDRKIKALQVTSSLSGEGKSTFLSNCAFLLAQKKYKTIIIDLDLRKPKVHKIFNVENSRGVTEFLAGRISLEKAIKTNSEYGFDVLTSGEKTSAVINLIESKKMNELFAELKQKYDYILVDSPPVINVSDPLYISKLADAVVFILAQSETKRALVKEAVNLLKRNNINVIGAVVTQLDLKNTRYGYGYGYGYSYGYGYDYKEDERSD